jgi:hypothetical protein
MYVLLLLIYATLNLLVLLTYLHPAAPCIPLDATHGSLCSFDLILMLEAIKPAIKKDLELEQSDVI